MEFFKWIYSLCPGLFEMIAVMVLATLIGVMGIGLSFLILWIFLPIEFAVYFAPMGFAVILFSLSVGYAVMESGANIKEWWRSRPWKR